MLHRKRLLVVFYFAIAALVILAGVIGVYSIVRASELQDKVESQWTRSVTVSANRGRILDVNGELLAASASTESVLLRPKEIDGTEGQVADLLAPILQMDRQKIYELASNKNKVEVYLKRHITDEQAAQIRKLSLDGVEFFIETERYYPNKSFLSQVLGYTTIDGVGQEGVEKKYNKYLAGQDGTILVQTDASGRTIEGSEETYIEATDGLDVVMTIDARVQSFAESAAEEAMQVNEAEGVVCIVMDPSSGDILAMVNNPGMDINDPDRSDIDMLNELSRNKAVVDAYEPGSTFKVITTAAAIDSGAANLESTFDCIGYKMVDGEKIKCWRTGRPHGHQTLMEGVANSCNPCFMEMALNMGTDTFYKYIKSFGFGSNTGIDYSADGAGIVRDPKYVRNVDLARIGFGQSVAVTPLQLATAVSAVINGGTLYQPRLVSHVSDESGAVVNIFDKTAKGQVISEQTSATMRSILENVVENGSGANAKIAGYRVGGKTGTAQLYDEDGNIVEGKHISSFIGFAPADDPKYLCLFVVYKANVAVDFGSVVAAPYARQILEKCLKQGGIAPSAESVDTVEVTDVSGKSISEAKSALEALGLTVDAPDTGTVFVQIPAAGTAVKKGSTVYLMAESTAEADLNVPDLSGKTLLEAVDLLKSVGMSLKVDENGVGSGVISTQNIAAGSEPVEGGVVIVSCQPTAPKVVIGQDDQGNGDNGDGAKPAE